MNNKKQFLQAYEALSPLEAFTFAHEVALQLSLRQKRLTESYCTQEQRVNLLTLPDAGDLSYSLNRAFELLFLTLWEEEYGIIEGEEEQESLATADIHLAEASPTAA